MFEYINLTFDSSITCASINVMTLQLPQLNLQGGLQLSQQDLQTLAQQLQQVQTQQLIQQLAQTLFQAQQPAAAANVQVSLPSTPVLGTSPQIMLAAPFAAQQQVLP